MKKVLYIAYFFPPLGGAGVQRSLKFCRYLPDSGWLPTVITSAASYWMQDESLLREIPEGMRVVRVAGPGGGGRAAEARKGSRSEARIRLLRAVSRFLLVPDSYVMWTRRAAVAARRALSLEKHDALLTTSSPDSSHLLGKALKRETGLPWVADFRDPWTRRLSFGPPTRWHRARQRRLERACLEEADRVVVTSEETRDDFLRLYPHLPAAKFAVVHNGYDEEDFVSAAALPAPSVPRAPVLHSGQLNPERPITPFLRGLRMFRDRAPDRTQEARTLFLGGHYDRHVEEARAAGLESLVQFAASRPHVESVAALLHARVLLLLEFDSDRGELILPGKIFEYLRAGTPILAVVPPRGAAARLVREMDAGIVVDPARAESVAEGLDALLSRAPTSPAGTGPLLAPARGGVASFERRALAARLAGVLDSLG